MRNRLCTICGGIYPEIFFYSTGHAIRGSTTSNYRRRMCEGCLTTRGDQKKRNNRFKDKARATRKRHAQKLGYTTEELRMMGWESEQMAHDIEHAYSNNCVECGDSFSEMGHGLRDITLDSADPQLQPYYPINVRWICQTDNSRKGSLSIAIWGIKKMCWKQWEEQIGPRQLSMFDRDLC